jgi:site-specific DNA-cytosine methylase
MRAVDNQGFAGGFALGVTQAGFDVVAKREPAAFKGFGVPSVQANLPGTVCQVADPSEWQVVNRPELVFGNPLCAGFSMLSAINTADSKSAKVVDGVKVSQRGIDSPDNIWMALFVDYAAKCQPDVAIFECVQSAGRLGAPLMVKLWEKMCATSGIKYELTEVFMDAALVGGRVNRPRYFWVAHRRPFGVDLPRLSAPNLIDVIGDLPAEEEPGDMSWGHFTIGSKTSHRLADTVRIFRENDFDWAQGTRLSPNMDIWRAAGFGVPDFWYNAKGEMLKHVTKDHLYAPFRWRENKPFGVVVGDFLNRAVHPVAPRCFTYREGARFMGLPDEWDLGPMTSSRNGPWLGKAIPVASGRWIATWAKASIEGNPGEYAGVEIAPGHRVIDVTTKAKVDAIDHLPDTSPVWWPASETVYNATYFYQGARPQVYAHVTPPAETERKTFTLSTTIDVPRVEAPKKVQTHVAPRRAYEPREPRLPVARAAQGTIVRVPPEEIQVLLASTGLTKKDAAVALDVSLSRINELMSHSRPASWLNADKLNDVSARLRAYADSIV